MGKKALTLGDNEIEKQKFRHYKNPVFLQDADLDKILISIKISFGEKNYKYFLGYLDDYEIKPLLIMLPKTKVYVKSYDGEAKWMYFLTEDDELLEKYNDIWIKVSNSI